MKKLIVTSMLLSFVAAAASGAGQAVFSLAGYGTYINNGTLGGDTQISGIAADHIAIGQFDADDDYEIVYSLPGYGIWINQGTMMELTKLSLVWRVMALMPTTGH